MGPDLRIEMGNVADDREEYLPAPKKVDKGRCFGCCKTCFQLPGIVQIVTTVALAAFFAAVFTTAECGKVANIPAATVIGGVGFAGALFLSICGFGFCCLARHWKPERDLRDEVENYRRQILSFENQVDILGERIKSLEKIRDDIKEGLEHNIALKNELHKDLQLNVEALKAQNDTLKQEVDRLERELEAFKGEMERQIAQVGEKAAVLNDVNQKYGEQSQKIDSHFTTIDLLKEEWNKNVSGVDRENDEYKEHNERMQLLFNELIKGKEEIKLSIAGFSKEIDELREAAREMGTVDDKAKDVAAIVAKNRPIELEESNERYRQFIEAIRKSAEELCTLYPKEEGIHRLLCEMDALHPQNDLLKGLEKVMKALEKSGAKKYEGVLKAYRDTFPKLGFYEGMEKLNSAIRAFKNRNPDNQALDKIKETVESILSLPADDDSESYMVITE